MESGNSPYDVIVVGAGPAGSTCARACALNGLRTLLLDKAVFPRQKPCGGALSVHGRSLLDFPLPDSLIEQECRGARIYCNGSRTEVRMDRPIAVLIDRARFDAYLADQAVAAGARFLQGETVIEVQNTGSNAIVRTEANTYEASYVVGTDGVQSRVAHFVRPAFRKDETVLALVTPVKPDDVRRDGLPRDMIGLYFGIADLGYGWLFPHQGHYSFGIAGLASHLDHPRDVLEAFGSNLGINFGPPQGRFIPLGGINRRVAAGRVLLAGDAAGFADPFHGEGIAHAILSGKLAATAIVEGIRKGGDPEDTASRYAAACERRIWKDLRIAYRLARGVDRFPGLFIRIFFDNKGPLERYLEIAAGNSDYRHFARWIAPRVPYYLLSSFLRGRRNEARKAYG
ncbi:MAG TPA: geranylgeranyl reductase family protein [Nitrospirota bacterium]|nr:geranylgeranyl reductase family protein [Nitrospirota bacterium]